MKVRRRLWSFYIRSRLQIKSVSERIIVSEEESPSHWHQKDYRSFNASTDWDTADFASAPPVYSMPVTSAICEPQHGESVCVRDGHIDVRGAVVRSFDTFIAFH